MGKLTLVLVVFCGCASVEKRPLETAIEYQRDAKAFAIPAVILSAVGLTAGVADIERPDTPALHGITIGCLAGGVIATVVAGVYGYLADKAREKAKFQAKAEAGRLR